MNEQAKRRLARADGVAREPGKSLRADTLDAKRSDGRRGVERTPEGGAFEISGFGEHAE